MLTTFIGRHLLDTFTKLLRSNYSIGEKKFEAKKLNMSINYHGRSTGFSVGRGILNPRVIQWTENWRHLRATFDGKLHDRKTRNPVLFHLNFVQILLPRMIRPVPAQMHILTKVKLQYLV